MTHMASEAGSDSRRLRSTRAVTRVASKAGYPDAMTQPGYPDAVAQPPTPDAVAQPPTPDAVAQPPTLMPWHSLLPWHSPPLMQVHSCAIHLNWQ